MRRLHKNAQRLLRPMIVVNPYAMELSFPDHATRTRRDHMKYLTLISAVTLLHQHQRPVRTATERGRRIEYIEATRQDVAVATRLAQGVLGRSLKRVHDATHPTALLEERAKKVDEEGTGDERREQVSSAELLSSLAAEAAEEAAAGAGSNDALAKTLGPPARRHAS
ncbi:MAG: hypothetical protein IPG04_24925 [Polyangiaceae bacterium]|nr:hypothetical protein [Polyangiaceae bacterium]